MKNAFELINSASLISLLVIFAIGFTMCLIYRKAAKFYIKEFLAMYSDNATFFSKKRIESGIAFLFSLGYTWVYVSKKIDSMDIWDFLMILGVWLGIAGYTMNMIQKEKKMELMGGAPKPAEEKK